MKTSQLVKVSRQILIYVLLILGAGIIMIPFVWMVSTSLKPTSEINLYPPTLFPKQIRVQNWVEAFNSSYLPAWVYFKNSLLLCLPVAFLDVVVSGMVGYAFARLRFRGSRVLFFLMLSTMLLPGQITMIPLFIIFAKLGWVDTYLPIIVPAFFGWPFAIFLLRQFFAGIPDELDAAAKIDGCNPLQIFRYIHMPLAKPALGVVAILSFTQMWGEYFRPLIYIRDPNKFPIALAMQSFLSARGQHWEYAMTMALVTSIVPLALFFVAQKSYIQGIVITGVKG